MGQTIETTVDSEIAKYYLEGYLQRNRTIPELDAKIDRLYQQHDRSPLDRANMRAVSDAFSVDFSALYLADRLWQNSTNEQLQRHFERRVVENKLLLERGATSSNFDAPNYLVLFVPGWNYKEIGHITGGDFSVPRMLMTELGLENYLVEIPPTGSVEENAHVLAREIVRYGGSKKAIILVGASSSGPAIHLVLGEQLDSRQLQAVKAWVNLGGILQGSPLIDHYQQWPRKYLFQLAMWYKGWDKESLLSMSAERSRERFERLVLPGHILVFNYLGLSLSGEVSRYSQDKYPILRREGPNDGLTPLTDIIAPGSMTIVALGSDHFFAEDPDINVKTVALAQTVVNYLERGKSP